MAAKKKTTEPHDPPTEPAGEPLADEPQTTRSYKLMKEIELTQAELAEHKRRLSEIENRVGRLELSGPAVDPTGLTPDQFDRLVGEDPHARLITLRQYSHMGVSFTANREFHAHHYPKLRDHIRNGLQVRLAS